MTDGKGSRELELQGKSKLFKCVTLLLCPLVTESSFILGTPSAPFKDSFGFQATVQVVQVNLSC